MNAQNRAELARNVPPDADDLLHTAVDPRKAEISMIKTSTARRNEFNGLMRQLHNELCKPLQKNANMVEDSTWKSRFDDKRSYILKLITKI